MSTYKGYRYRIVTALNERGREVFCVDFRRWFLFFPYWQRWHLFHGNALYGTYETLEFQSVNEAEVEFKKKVDAATFVSRVVKDDEASPRRLRRKSTEDTSAPNPYEDEDATES